MKYLEKFRFTRKNKTGAMEDERNRLPHSILKPPGFCIGTQRRYEMDRRISASKTENRSATVVRKVLEMSLLIQKAYPIHEKKT